MGRALRETTDIDVYDLFRSKFGDREARILVEYFKSEVKDEVEESAKTFATKEDLANAKSEIKEENAITLATKADIARLEKDVAKVEASITNVKKGLREDIAKVEKDIAKVEDDIAKVQKDVSKLEAIMEKNFKEQLKWIIILMNYVKKQVQNQFFRQKILTHRADVTRSET